MFDGVVDDILKQVKPMANKYIKEGKEYIEGYVEQEEKQIKQEGIQLLAQIASGVGGVSLIMTATLPTEMQHSVTFLAPAAYLGAHKWLAGKEFWLLAAGLLANYSTFNRLVSTRFK